MGSSRQADGRSEVTGVVQGEEWGTSPGSQVCVQRHRPGLQVQWTRCESKKGLENKCCLAVRVPGGGRFLASDGTGCRRLAVWVRPTEKLVVTLWNCCKDICIFKAGAHRDVGTRRHNWERAGRATSDQETLRALTAGGMVDGEKDQAEGPEEGRGGAARKAGF